MDNWWIGVAVVVVLALALLWRARRPSGGESGRALEDLDTLAGWEPQATRVLTSQERAAYQVAIRALPEYIILAQVPLARFLKVPTRHSYSEWLHRVGQLCADLVVCDSASQVIAVIDVRAPAEKTSERAQKRQQRMRRVLKAARIPMHIWIENNLPTVEGAREAIFPSPPEGAAPVAARAAAPAREMPAPVRPPLEFELPEREEETIELREPPPSTWFDNLDPGPTPPRNAPANKPTTR